MKEAGYVYILTNPSFKEDWVKIGKSSRPVDIRSKELDNTAVPLPEMYGKNLTFKTGGVDGCDCAEILRLIEAGKIDTTPLITHRYKLADIADAYHLFENKLDGVIKVAVEP